MTRMKSKTKIASGWESWAQQQVLYMYDAIINFPSWFVIIEELLLVGYRTAVSKPAIIIKRQTFPLFSIEIMNYNLVPFWIKF